MIDQRKEGFEWFWKEEYGKRCRGMEEKGKGIVLCGI